MFKISLSFWFVLHTHLYSKKSVIYCWPLFRKVFSKQAELIASLGAYFFPRGSNFVPRMFSLCFPNDLCEMLIQLGEDFFCVLTTSAFSYRCSTPLPVQCQEWALTNRNMEMETSVFCAQPRTLGTSVIKKTFRLRHDQGLILFAWPFWSAGISKFVCVFVFVSF